jgi:hypothetical protein
MKAQGFYAVMWHDNAVKPQESQVVMGYDTWQVQPNTPWRVKFEVVPDFAHSFQGKTGQPGPTRAAVTWPLPRGVLRSSGTCYCNGENIRINLVHFQSIFDCARSSAL